MFVFVNGFVPVRALVLACVCVSGYVRLCVRVLLYAYVLD